MAKKKLISSNKYRPAELASIRQGRDFSIPGTAKPQTLAEFLITEACAWVEDQKDGYRKSARSLTGDEKAGLRDFFSPEILEKARIKLVPGIENPGFYSILEKDGIGVPFDMRGAAGITCVDTVVVAEKYLFRETPSLSLLFHELVHVTQYHVLGVKEFMRRYIRGWAENGFDYYSIPLESQAYQLQARFQANPGLPFPVIEEVLRTR